MNSPVDFIKSTWWSIVDKKRYRLNKLQVHQQKIQNFLSEHKILTIPDIIDLTKEKPAINYIHTGNIGDIIYALPVIKQLSNLIDKPNNLLLKINVPMRLATGLIHPLKSVMLNEQSVKLITPLLENQRYVHKCDVYTDQHIDINLSLFRKSGMYLNRGNIARWNFYTTGVTANLSEQWLFVEPDLSYSDTIVIARSQRYQNPLISYSFLSAYHKVVFLGVKDEFKDIQKHVLTIKHIEVKDFLEMGRIIAGGKLFIGNQSFPYSLAEALKVPRILETYYSSPNVMPEGKNGYDFYFQKHFEFLVGELYNK